jgi:hypothetical protein
MVASRKPGISEKNSFSNSSSSCVVERKTGEPGTGEL